MKNISCFSDTRSFTSSTVKHKDILISYETIQFIADSSRWPTEHYLWEDFYILFLNGCHWVAFW